MKPRLHLNAAGVSTYPAPTRILFSRCVRDPTSSSRPSKQILDRATVLRLRLTGDVEAVS